MGRLCVGWRLLIRKWLCRHNRGVDRRQDRVRTWPLSTNIADDRLVLEDPIPSDILRSNFDVACLDRCENGRFIPNVHDDYLMTLE